MTRLRAWWTDTWYGEPGLSDIAMRSEHRLAQGRVVLIATLTIVGLIVASREVNSDSYVNAIPVNLFCFVLAVAALIATRRGERPIWLGTATAIGDVSLVTLLHVIDLLQRAPSEAVNGRITFTGYFFALLGTCARWDKRISIGTALVAALQYAGIVVVAERMWPNAVTADVAAYGQFDAGVQIERIATLVLFGFGCGSVAQWTLRLREYATTDPLTRLSNRRTFEERVRDELLKTVRNQSQLSVVLVDLDHFKLVNDAHGHHAGDHVLRQVADNLRAASRRTDLVSRWGGEEFALAFLDAPLQEASAKAEALRVAMETSDIRLPGGEAIVVTLSAGVATATDAGHDFDALMNAADRNLLAAKREGRNRVVA